MTEPTPTALDPRQRQMVIFGVSLSVIFVVGIFALLIFRSQLFASADTPTTTLEPTRVPGVRAIDIPYELIDFTLTGKDGAPLALSDLRGKYTLLFFGYTHCPDVCPLTLAEFKRVSDDLGDAAGNVNFLFISVDGERDTPNVLNAYVSRFNSSFYAMQGDLAVLETIAGDYGLVYALFKENDADTNYAVDHTTAAFMVDPQGRLVATIDYGTDDAIITEALRARL